MKYLILLCLSGCVSYEGINRSYDNQRQQIENEYQSEIEKWHEKEKPFLLENNDRSILLSEKFLGRSLRYFKTKSKLNDDEFSNQYLNEATNKYKLCDTSRSQELIKERPDQIFNDIHGDDKKIIANQSDEISKRLMTFVVIETICRHTHNDKLLALKNEYVSALNRWKSQELKNINSEHTQATLTAAQINLSTSESMQRSLNSFQNNLEQNRRNHQMDMMLMNQSQQINQLNQLLFQMRTGN